MTVRMRRWARRRPLYAAVLLAGVLLLTWATLATAADLAESSVFLREVEALDGEPDEDLSRIAWAFPFRDRTVTVTARISASELEAAESITTESVFTERGWLRDRYVRGLIEAQSESALVDRLGEELSRIANELRLDDDGRLELMVAAVQAIPYGDVRREIRLPVEVIAYRGGVCTEKTVLLAALLLREDWDTCVWVFDTQRHVALGVRADGAGFHGSGYAFIETTERAYVGQSEPKYRARGPIARLPQRIELGGERRYSAGYEAGYILAILDLAQKGTVRLAAYPGYLAAGDGDLGSRYAALADAHETASTLEAFILANTHDRPGVYARLITETGIGRIGSSLGWDASTWD